MSGRLEGRTALVTGASRGIGTAIALRLAVEGAAVAVTARTLDPGTSSLPGTLAETVQLINEEGGRAVAIAADLADPAERQGIVAQAEAALGPIDILVNNAAVTFLSPIETFTAKRRQLMFEVQVNAPMDLAQQVLPAMTAAGQGWILNISSGAARHPAVPPDPQRGPGGTVYGMCKAALERFTTGLASELWAANIAVNALSPNRVVPTPGTIFHHLVHLDDPSKDEPPEVMAEAALALCSRSPRTLTGRIAYSQDLLDELGLAAPTVGI
jgi:citronellol/citronellal dehydrogenase